MRFWISSIALAALTLVTAQVVFAEKIAIGVAYGIYTPTSSATRDKFDSTWTRLSLTTFQREQPQEWRFISDIGAINANGQTEEISVIPITVGMARGFKEKKKFQPYVVGRTGPYYGRVKTIATGDRDSKIGWNANVAGGLIYKKRYYLEARYDYYTDIADTNLSGLSLSIGTRLFDINL